MRRRLARLFRLYWWVAVPLTALALAAGRLEVGNLWKVPLWLMGLGVLSRSTFFPVVDGWWYISLAAQVVLVAPGLLLLVRRFGVGRTAFAAAAVSQICVLLVVRIGASYLVQGFVGCWLFELTIGMALGIPGGLARWSIVDRAVVALVAATLLLASPDVNGVRLVAIALVALALTLPSTGEHRGIRWAGSLTFAFYLAHSPWAKLVLAAFAGLSPQFAVVLALPLSLLVALVAAVIFRETCRRVPRALTAAWTRGSHDASGGC